MDQVQLQNDHAAVKETYWQDGEFYKWKIDLANGNVLTGQIPFDPIQGEEALKGFCKLDAEAMLQTFLGLDSTTLVPDTDPSRIEQIAKLEADLERVDVRLVNLREGITTGIYLDAEELSIDEQVRQLENYKNVLLRKLNRMKL